jgi:REP element-mobilizing transposase RayT
MPLFVSIWANRSLLPQGFKKLSICNTMSRNYKFHNKGGLYFVSFATVYWLDIFVRELYFTAVVESLDHCRKNKGMEIYCWCIMPSHIHLIIRAKDNNPEIVLGKFKEHTSKQLHKLILENTQESRKEWLLWMMQRAASKSSNVTNSQLWQPPASARGFAAASPVACGLCE